MSGAGKPGVPVPMRGSVGATPGPWKVTKRPDGYSGATIARPDGLLVALTLGADDDAQEMVNAELIASAPALAAENERLRAALERCADLLSRGTVAKDREGIAAAAAARLLLAERGQP